MCHMLKLARTTYVIGSIGFIAIGALHTAVHAAELAGDPLKQRFDELGQIRVSGQDAAAWDLFQGTSLLMGFFSIAIGLGAIGALRAVGPRGAPPAGTAIVNIAVLISVIVVGFAYFGALQIYGGLFGIAMFAPAVALPLRMRGAGRGSATVNDALVG